MIRGSEEETTLVARIETNIPSRMPESASRTSRWVIFVAVSARCWWAWGWGWTWVCSVVLCRVGIRRG